MAGSEVLSPRQPKTPAAPSSPPFATRFAIDQHSGKFHDNVKRPMRIPTNVTDELLSPSNLMMTSEFSPEFSRKTPLSEAALQPNTEEHASNSRKLKRPRAAQACERCRLKKYKCDEHIPCFNCKSEATVM